MPPPAPTTVVPPSPGCADSLSDIRPLLKLTPSRDSRSMAALPAPPLAWEMHHGRATIVRATTICAQLFTAALLLPERLPAPAPADKVPARRPPGVGAMEHGMNGENLLSLLGPDAINRQVVLLRPVLRECFLALAIFVRPEDGEVHPTDGWTCRRCRSSILLDC